MSTFLGLGTSVLFGNTVRASTELLTDLIRPISPNDTVVIDGNVQSDNINLTATETNIGVNVTHTTAGQDNTFVGGGAGENNTTGDDNTFLGRAAGNMNTTGEDNVFVGTSAGFSNTSGSRNTYVGRSAGVTNSSGDNNTFVGRLAGNDNTTGDNNTFIGQASALANTTGRLNTFLGSGSGNNNTTGDQNTFLGFNAGLDNTTGVGNVCIGNQARGPETGGDNVIIGDGAGFNVDLALTGCVLLGHDAGANNTVDDRLMIDNTDTDDPLINGDFAANTLQINGVATLGQSGNTTNVHAINGLINTSASVTGSGDATLVLPTNAVAYLNLDVNGTTYQIPMFT